MFKSLIIALFLATSSVALADEAKTCITFEQVKEKNASFEADYVALTDEQFKNLQATFKAHDAELKPEVVSMMVGQSAKIPGMVFLFGFDKDKCFIVSGHLPVPLFMQAISPGNPT